MLQMATSSQILANPLLLNSSFALTPHPTQLAMVLLPPIQSALSHHPTSTKESLTVLSRPSLRSPL
ncbi:rCG58590 [Rattus norvegicus]|uniref:RCG58590 n=1 Tax=Rattus norvegicus TaxID=10116 RepID=A6KR82_RAT|nr:rCG58590 [Rattus norvegicus]